MHAKENFFTLTLTFVFLKQLLTYFSTEKNVSSALHPSSERLNARRRKFLRFSKMP